MKLGIMTIHKAMNYGAVLQATGLYQYLEGQYPSACEIIDYEMNPRICETVAEKQKLINVLKRKAQRLLQLRGMRARIQRFNTFKENNYRLSGETYCGDEQIKKNPPRYDAYISGSDQIFNLKLTNTSKAYYLDFVQDKRKIAYSSSFGMGGLNEEDMEQIKDLLLSYDHISIRERSAVEPLQQLLNKPIIATCDPVFLLDAQQWEAKMEKVRIPDRYILIYAMSNNPNLHETLHWLRKKEKLPVIILKNGTYSLPVRGRMVRNAGPAEFLYLMKHATYVLTNSFHGTAFSVIFGRKFFCLEEEKYIADHRYGQMLHCAGIDGCVTPYNTDWENFDFEAHLMDGAQVYNSLRSWIEQSKSFLNESITQEKE